LTQISRDERGGPCPPNIELAAFVDGDLTTEARARLVTHLTACDDCREIVATAAAALQVQQRAAPRWFRRRGVVVALASGLAATLALVLAPRGAPASPTWADLARAIGPERAVEARLSAPDGYLALKSPTRSAASPSGTPSNFALDAIVSRLREQTQSDRTAANLHLLGVGTLALGHVDEAIAVLTHAAARAGSDARVFSDLAAAHATRAARAGLASAAQEAWTKALEEAERASALDPSLAPASFNRALALDGLRRRDDAREAWRSYLTQFPADDGWHVEAVSRMRAEPR
jgi:tetratricopeptide (TPR) repeat protein